ncbi:MAG: ABC transporter substrate-binding protein [Actinomycetota bacterium]
MRRSKKLLALAAASALVIAACGDDDDDGGSSDTTTAETTATTEADDMSDEETTESTEADDMSEEDDMTEDTTEGTVDDDEAVAEGAGFAVDTSVCEDPDAATATIEDTIKIGTSIPLTGGPAVLFAPFGAGQQAYIDYYNAEFGGVNGQELELVVKDDMYTADLTKANTDELVFDDEVDVIGGVIGSPNNLAIQADLNAQCVPQLWASTGAPNWGAVDEFPWTTGLLVAYDIESAVWANWVIDNIGEGSSVGLFYVNNEFGQSYANAFNAAADELGLDIVAEEVIDPADAGAPSGQMTNLVEANPDAILAVPLGAQCIAFMTELGNAKAANPDFDPAVYQTATCASPVFFGAVANGGADGVYSSNNLKDVNNPEVVANDEGAQEYLEAFAATGSDADPGGIALAGWESMELTVWAIQDAADNGTLSRESIINSARTIDHVSILLRDGLTYRMNGEDGFIGEGTQILAWNDADQVFEDQGDIINLEGSLGVYSG